ncbi:putative fibrillin-1, partial [Ixodes scapularis]
LDECASGDHGCRYACKNLVGTFQCICPDGMRSTGRGDDCTDINECQENPDICQNGECINTHGGYRCRCYHGFEPSSNGKQCLDNRLGTCYQTASSCPNSNGQLGLTSRDECCCSVGIVWGSHCEACPQRNTQEFNSLCELGTGFNKDGQDVNECETLPHLCNNGRCINTQGSYRCLCNRGYKTDPTGTRCVDVNECELPVSPCKSKCLNTEGSYICSCDDGYVLAEDKVSCKDVDECATDRHNCEHSCINTQGSYRCSCKDGYNVLESQCL